MDNFYNQINKLRLNKIYSYIINTNPSSNLPYHNTFHLEHVCQFSLLGADFYNLSNDDKKILATAALFHDYNHTGSGKNDDININNAIEGFLKFNSNDKVEKFKEFNFNKKEMDIIINLIKSTRYPYITECDTLMEKILRDSDVLQGPFCQNYINGVVFGIAKENNIPFEKMIDGQVSFLKSMKFNTDWANDLYKKILPQTINKVEEAMLLFK